MKDDLISRQDAIDSISADIMGGLNYESILKKLPSADRPQGEWVDEGDPLTIRCSKCDYRAARYNNTNYCPNCGAHMKGADDDIH